MLRVVVALCLAALAAPAAALQVTRVRVPKVVKLSDRRITRPVRTLVTVRNETSEAVTWPDAAALATDLGITATPGAGDLVCPALVPEIARALRFPVTLRPGRRRQVAYRLTITCGPVPGPGTDFTIAARGTSAALDVVDRRASTAFQRPGRYAVGTTKMTLVDASRPTMPNGSYPGAPDRTLPTLVWYPADAAGADVPVATDGAPFPFVVFSHGLGSPADQSARYTAHLASHGYVVIAPAYPLSRLGAQDHAQIADIPNQAGDVSFLIDRFLALSTAPTGPLSRAIDGERIAATGHSNGGLTTLVATYDAVVRDPRIKAAIPLSPPSCFLQPGYFGSVAVPLLVLHGDNDLLAPFASHGLVTYERANAPKSLVRVRNGNHVGFADFGTSVDDLQICAFLPPPGQFAADSLALLQNMGGAANHVTLDGCGASLGLCQGDPRHIDGARQEQIAKQTATAFLDALFRGDQVAARYLYEELAVTSPDLIHDFAP